MPDENNNISILVSPERAKEIQEQLGLKSEGILTALLTGTLDINKLSRKLQPLKSSIKPSYQGEIKDANKERLNRSLSNYASNNFLLSTSNIRPDLYGNYNPELGTFAGNLNILTLSMGFDPFNASNYYKAATLFPKFKNWGLTRSLANELNAEVKVVEALGKNIGKQTLVPTVRTKIGDVEINNPSLNYRVGTKEIVQDFNKVGKVRAGETNALSSKKIGNISLNKETFANPMFKQGSLWYQPSEEMSGLLVTSKPLTVATKSSAPVANNGIFTINGKTFINDFGGRRIPNGLILNKSNTSSYIWTPLYGYKLVQQEPKTSLKFFERPLSKISMAEKLGIPKGDRGNLNKFQKESLEDLEQYIKSGLYRLIPSIIDDNIIWGNNINDFYTKSLNSPRRIQYKGAYIRQMDGNPGKIWVSVPSRNLAGGEASLTSIGGNEGKIILTSPKTSASLQDNKLYSFENAPETIPKSGMRTFWTAVQDTRLPGSYLSGDLNRAPLGLQLIRDFDNNKIGVVYDNNKQKKIILPHKWDNILKHLYIKQKWFNRGDLGLSTDSYLALLKQANRKNSPYWLRYSPDGAQFNDRGVENKFIFDLLEKTKTGEATLQEFLEAFHNWVAPYGGMDAKIVNGEIVIPHPFLYKKKQGGKIIEKFKNRNK